MTTPSVPDLADATVQLVSALLDSADIELIGRNNWYPRAQSALETAAAGSTSTAQAVTTMAHKLQVDVLNRDASATVTALAPVIDAQWSEWVEQVSRESVYLIAMTRVTRSARNASKKEAN